MDKKILLTENENLSDSEYDEIFGEDGNEVAIMNHLRTQVIVKVKSSPHLKLLTEPKDNDDDSKAKKSRIIYFPRKCWREIGYVKFYSTNVGGLIFFGYYWTILYAAQVIENAKR